MKEVQLTNYADGWQGKKIPAFESTTDKRYILDLGNLGFSASEVSFKASSDGFVKVMGKVGKGNPTYDADGDLDKFGHNAVRKDFEVHFTLNTAKYNLSTLKVSTQDGITRVEAMQYGAYKSAPKTYKSGSWKNPVYKAPARTYGLSFQNTRRAESQIHFYACGCPCYRGCYEVYVPHTVKSGMSQRMGMN